MEQKIDLEIRLRGLAARSLLEARNEVDVLEVEKALLVSEQRMNCYVSQLVQERKQSSTASLNRDSCRISKCACQYNNNNNNYHRSDVVGDTTSPYQIRNGVSPTLGSLSSSQSPKLSPVSGDSANSQPSFASSGTQSRTGAFRHSTNTLNAKQRAKNKKREQLMQNITKLSNINCNMVINNRASISVSEIRIPLMWRDVDHFKGRGDYKRFAIFCLLKIDSQIYDTQLISDVDREVTDVTFDDLVVFNEIDHNFELCIEVYSCVYLEQFSLSSTPRKIRKKLTSSVGKAMGRRLLTTQTASANYTKELRAYDKSNRFAMIASAVLRLEDASDSAKAYDLILATPSAHHRLSAAMSTTYNNGYNMSMTLSNGNKRTCKNTLPLFGHFCCKLLVVPDIYDKNIKTGFLKVASITNTPQQDSPANKLMSNKAQLDKLSSTTLSFKMSTMSISNAIVHYGILRNFELYLWPVNQKRLDAALSRRLVPQIDIKQLQQPAPLILTMDKYTRLIRVSNTSLTLETDKGCYIIAAYCSYDGLTNRADEMGHWLRCIEQPIYDSHIWSSVLNQYPNIAPLTKSSTSDEENFGRTTQSRKNNLKSKQRKVKSDSYYSRCITS